jgi:hypothetical protein
MKKSTVFLLGYQSFGPRGFERRRRHLSRACSAKRPHPGYKSINFDSKVFYEDVKMGITQAITTNKFS